VQILGESKRAYLAVIALLGLAFTALPDISVYDFEVQALRGCCGLGSNFQTVTEIAEPASFLISPCLFFVALYIYGKRTAQHFSGGYLGIGLSLLLGSCIGFTIYILSTPIINGVPVSLSLLYSFDFLFGTISGGVRDAFIGIAAIALSHLSAKPSTTLPEGLPESTIQ
jgi:hypothetical protein